MAKLILVVDVPGSAMALVDEMANNGNAKFTVKANSGRRSQAFLGQQEEAPYANVFDGPGDIHVDAAFVTDEQPRIEGEGIARRYRLI